MLGLLCMTATLGGALAQDSANSQPAAPMVAAPVAKPPPQFEIGFRARRVSVPDSILDIWYVDDDEDAWGPAGVTRPKIQGYALGIEFIIKRDDANSIFYVEHITSQMKPGYFDDVEAGDDPDNALDGEFFAPSDNLGMFVFGANYAYEAKLVTSERTHGVFGWSLVVGGGLGLAIRTGNSERWFLESGVPSYERYENGEPSDDIYVNRPPRLLPMVDINAGTRFTFGDKLSLRIEGGLHTLAYYGATAGMIF